MSIAVVVFIVVFSIIETVTKSPVEKWCSASADTLAGIADIRSDRDEARATIGRAAQQMTEASSSFATSQNTRERDMSDSAARITDATKAIATDLDASDTGSSTRLVDDVRRYNEETDTPGAATTQCS